MTFQPDQDDVVPKPSDKPREPSSASGLRGRFRDTRPPVVTRDSNVATAGGSSWASGENNNAAGDQDVPDAQNASDEDVVRAGSSMAIATLLSRITGFLRTVLIGSALGPAIASAFNTANTLPNLITELVLGAVLTSLVVPVLVRAEKEDPDKGAAFIRRLLTLTFSLTLGITILSVLGAPLLVRMSLDSSGHVNIGMSTAWAYLVLPQIVFYAMFAVFMAVLNTKGVFKPGAWAPVVNNIVTLAVLGLYYLLPEDTKLQPSDSVTITDPHILLVGLGTTIGVIVQALIMVPYLRKAGIDLRPLWGIDARLKSFGGMAIAIVVYVAISQVGFILNNRIASSASAEAPTIYMQAWQLLQVPYGVIGVTLLTAVMPRLSRNAAEGDDKAVVKDLSSATKLTMLALIPVILYFTVFGTVIAQAMFAYGKFTLEFATILGWTISFSAFTLIPYALVLLHLRVFYAREEVWTPTFIIAGITFTKLVLAYIAPLIASEPRLVVVLLGAANGFGFVAGAIIGDRLLRRSLGRLGFRDVFHTCLWTGGASIAGAAVAFPVDQLIEGFPVLLRMAITGVIFLVITGLVLSRSKLPEVMMVGRTFSRFLPARFRPAIPAVEEDMEELSPEEFAAREAAAMERMMGGGTMGAVGMLPPMRAAALRGPRLVPGAPLLQGRYRLLADHGGSDGLRFWQARELATDRLVALSIIEPSRWPNPERAKDEILRDSAKLKEIDSAGMAGVTRVIDAGNLVVIVAHWVEGSPLSQVAKSAPDPSVAASAVASLADAAAQADHLGTSLGLDHRERVRIALADGAAFVAFPGAVPGGGNKQDAEGISASLSVLLEQVPADDIPESLHEVYQDMEHVNASPEEVDFDLVARQLRAVSGLDKAGSSIHVHPDSAPDPAAKTGFGAHSNRPTTYALSALIAFAIVAVVVAVVAGLLSVLGGQREDSPLTPDSLRQGAQSVTRLQDPAPVPLSNAREWMPEDGRGELDSPELAPLVLDGDPATTWSSDSYLDELGPQGVKDGIGLLIDMPQATSLTEATLHGVRQGMQVEIRVAKDSTYDVTRLDQTELLRTVDITGEKATVPLPENPEKESPHSNKVLLWITKLSRPSGEATLSGIDLVGTYAKSNKERQQEGTSSTSQPAVPAG